ncbi:TMEM175 family protein [Companilactobacillus sp.]|uniref:TMEM175 family protein n=1 Tax=Companilactobacillus sp. TaxID=2767905 RepID=UPI00260F9823|nr:TMEM175 family protein [Companilactobacillus sp.]
MKKGRIEAFSDGVLAIIITIMILEIKTPESGHARAMFGMIPYFVSFVVSFILVCIGWYNQHYVISVTKWFSRRAFWANSVWLFVMAFLPVATAWVSEFWWMRAPEMFYLIVYACWNITFHIFIAVLYRDHKDKYPKVSKKLAETRAGQKKFMWLHVILFTIGFILTYFWPMMSIAIIFIESVIWFGNVPRKRGDQFEI